MNLSREMGRNQGSITIMMFITISTTIINIITIITTIITT